MRLGHGLAQASSSWKRGCTHGQATARLATYTNPLFFDEFSDPDMIRVGNDFYLTGTTMHSMPGLPVLRSRDLVNWTFVGYALDRLDLGPSFRLEDGKNEYGKGIWAPCFRFHDRTYYIFSNVNGQTTQLFRATSPVDEAVPALRPRGPGAGRQSGTSPGWPGRCSLPVASQVSTTSGRIGIRGRGQGDRQ